VKHGNMKILGFSGPSGSGKTTLIERLIAEFSRRGLRVSAVKHAHHKFDFDSTDKDTYRFRTAGAGQVMIGGPERWALMTETTGEPAGLEQLLSELHDCDLVLIEGMRSRASVARIEIYGENIANPLPESDDPTVIAVASDHPVDRALPRFARDDVAAIADFVAAHLGL